MQEPNEKEIGSFGNDLVVDAVRMKLRWYQGTRLTESRPCPDCGQENYRKHDFAERIFAILITEDGFEEITVEYRRFWCQTCQRTFAADLSRLFYEECMYGKPLVNLCLQLSATLSSTSVERQLQQIGIQVDRHTVRRYVRLFGEDYKEFKRLLSYTRPRGLDPVERTEKHLEQAHDRGLDLQDVDWEWWRSAQDQEKQRWDSSIDSPSKTVLT